MSRTGSVARLYNHEPQPALEMHADDMQRRSLPEGGLVRIKSRRGELVLPVRASASLRPGLAFLAMHWSAQAIGQPGANALTLAACDPYSKQPELKHAAIQVEKAAAPLSLVVLRRAAPGEDDTRIAALMAQLQPRLAGFAHATLTLAGRDAAVLVLRAWGALPDAPTLAALDEELGLADPGRMLSFADARRGISKRALIDGGILTGVRLAGETAARDWLLELMVDGTPADEVRRWIFAPVFQPPAGSHARGRIVCNCFDVAASEIAADRAAGLDLAAIQSKRKCGTSCGSCLPELRRLTAGD
jgi:assimilatory nitrate reductase catalytic subunit